MHLAGSPPWCEESTVRRRNLIIGQAPARDGYEKRPFDSDSGRRLAELFRIPHTKLLELFDTTNLNAILYDAGDIGPAGHWDAFDRKEAYATAKQLWPVLLEYHTVLMVGKRIPTAFRAVANDVKDHIQLPILQGVMQLQLWDATVISNIPHTSGRNPFWNDKANYLAAVEFLRIFRTFVY